jgi:hypothetical protein
MIEATTDPWPLLDRARRLLIDAKNAGPLETEDAVLLAALQRHARWHIARTVAQELQPEPDVEPESSEQCAFCEVYADDTDGLSPCRECGDLCCVTCKSRGYCPDCQDLADDDEDE